MFDVFGMTAERRMERALIVEFESLMDATLAELSPANLETACKVAAAFMDIRGYGPVKEAAVADVRDTITGLQANLLPAREAEAR